MKSLETQQKSYDKQKEIFETARDRRISNRKAQIEKINAKILSLQSARVKLIQQNNEEKEFESFDSFRRKAEEQSRLQKEQKTQI